MPCCEPPFESGWMPGPELAENLVAFGLEGPRVAGPARRLVASRLLLPGARSQAAAGGGAWREEVAAAGLAE